MPQDAPLPPGNWGFGLFSPTHLLVLAILAVGIAVLVVAYKRASAPVRRRLQLTFGWTTLMLEVLRQIGIAAQGLYDPSYIPLHLCAMAEFVIFVDCLHSSRWTREPLYALGIWGATCALVFADWTNRPIFNIYSWQAFLIHACIVGYILMRLVAGEIVPTWRNLWRVVIVMGCFVGVAAWANAVFGTDFWYLATGSPGSPLEPIQNMTGAYYIPALAVLLIILWVIMYTPWGLHARHVTKAEKALAAPVS